jgi:uncharacterized protein
VSQSLDKERAPRATDARVVVGKSDIEGSGLLAGAPIRAGEVVKVWHGQIITDQELHEIEAQGKKHSSVAIGENQNILFGVVESSGSEGAGGYNHSCDPNLWMSEAVTVSARRDIAAGEELTIDYALFTVSPSWSMACRCGSHLCRGTITGNDWRLPDLQQRYAGHFSPFINERIQRLNEMRA